MEELIKENDGLIYMVINKLNLNRKDIEDWHSIGMIGLIKGIKTYNKNKAKYSTYLTTCIRNEILMQFRKKKDIKCLSLDLEYFDNRTLKEIIPNNDKKDYSLELEYLKKAMNKLEYNERMIICKYYGIGCERLNQKQLADLLNTNQSLISRKHLKICDKLYYIMCNMGIDNLL